MRLDRMIANMGIGSRKDVRQMIRQGHVAINGKTITKHGTKVKLDHDLVTVHGEELIYREFIYIMLNKPKGVISATEDYQHSTVIDLLPYEYIHFKPFPVGRLDIDTVGLLLLTNDGKLAHELTSPKKEIEKTYFAKIKGKITPKHIEEFSKGLTLDDGYQTKPAKLSIIESNSVSEVHITITEGKFHQVKRMFQAIGREVVFLQRIKMGELKLDDSLALGEFRELRDEELAYCLSLKK